MAGASEESKKAAVARVRELEALKKEIESREPELEGIRERALELGKEAARLEGEERLLESVPLPKDAEVLSKEIESARERLARARNESASAEKVLLEAEEIFSRFPDTGSLTGLREHRARLREAERELEKAREGLARSEREKDTAVAEEQKTRELLEDARRRLAAHDLRGHLVEGAACPVCQALVEKIPREAQPPALASAEKAVAKAAKEKTRAEAEWQEASHAAARAGERVQGIAREIAALEKKLKRTWADSEIASELENIRSAASERERARERKRIARESEARAQNEAEKLASDERRAFRLFEEARDRVAPLGPPPTDRENLLRAWQSLADWAKAEIPRRKTSRQKAAEAARALESERERKLEETASRCRALEVPLTERPRDGVVQALAKAEQQAERIERARERAAFLRDSVKKETEDAQVAGALGQHLRSTGFERWLLEEAFGRLVRGATSILRELSSGQYSFEYDDRLNFEVIDHRNADERRSARTLSGGETFLASLALALTLAEQTVELAAEGSARLESLFLDEGFGTLDDETLDVVAAAIAELGARGRVVGVVTHQQNLAATIPVQYRVSKNPVTATVTKVVL